MSPLMKPLVPALILLLAACSSPEPPRAAKVKETPPARDLVAEVRAAGADAGDVIEVQPLRDPAVEDLLFRAHHAEQKRAWKDADGALAQALQLTPDDPELLQRHAEVQLARGEMDRAEQLAQASFQRGPKLGGLCRRNWATVRVVRESRGDQPGVTSAAAQLERCVIEPPVRM